MRSEKSRDVSRGGAAVRAADGSPRLHFFVIGDGHLRGALERQAREAGIRDRVAFTGFREDATSLYADLDVVALTSLNEGTPLTLIEALACGRAVAATEVGGVVDLLGARREDSRRIHDLGTRRNGAES